MIVQLLCTNCNCPFLQRRRPEARAGTSAERGPAHLSGAALTMAIRQAAKHRDAERQWQRRRVWQVRADCARKLRDKASHWAVNL
jgi:hypothetical protein